jgi:hypothetical protein
MIAPAWRSRDVALTEHGMYEGDRDEVRIGMDPGAFAVVAPPILDPHGCGRIPVRIEANGLRASGVAEMVLRPVTDLAAYFDDMARAWRGWAGEKTWADDDGQVDLRATHDGKGAVDLEVELRDMAYQGPGHWNARAIVPIEPGALDKIAVDLRAILSRDLRRR